MDILPVEFISDQNDYLNSLDMYTKNAIGVWTTPNAKDVFTNHHTDCVNYAIANAPKTIEDIIVYKAIYEDFRDMDYNYPYSVSLDKEETYKFLLSTSSLDYLTDEDIKERIDKMGYVNTILKIRIKAGTPVLIVEQYSGLLELLLLSPNVGEFTMISEYVDDILYSDPDSGEEDFIIPVKFIDLDYTPNDRLFKNVSISNVELLKQMTNFDVTNSTFTDFVFPVASGPQMNGICNVSNAIYDSKLKRIIITEFGSRVKLYGSIFGVSSHNEYTSRIYFTSTSLDNYTIEDITLPDYLLLGNNGKFGIVNRFYDITEDDIELFNSFKPFTMENYLELTGDYTNIISFLGKWMHHDLLYFLYSTLYDPMYLEKIKEYKFTIDGKEHVVTCNIPFIKGIYYASLICNKVKIQNCPLFSNENSENNLQFKPYKFNISNYSVYSENNYGFISFCFEDTLKGLIYINELLKEHDIEINIDRI